jgi:hypothetical protein
MIYLLAVALVGGFLYSVCVAGDKPQPKPEKDNYGT